MKPNLFPPLFFAPGIVRHGRSGFTLIELIVVVAIMALLYASAAMMVRQPLEHSRWGHVVAQLEALDESARLRSRRSGPHSLVFDQANGRVTIQDRSGVEVGPALVLPTGLAITSVVTPERSQAENLGARRQTVVQFDRYGVASSYAVRVKSTETSRPWLVVTGMVGQRYLERDKGAAYAIVNRERRHTD